MLACGAGLFLQVLLMVLELFLPKTIFNAKLADPDVLLSYLVLLTGL